MNHGREAPIPDMAAPITRAAVAAVIGPVLGTTLTADRNLSRKEIPAWDSVKHVEVVFALEDAFDVRFPEERMGAVDSLDAAVAAVESLRAA